MALLPQHTYFVYNGEICKTTKFILSENEGGIYEVLRVEKGVPLFLDDHLKRFYHSAQIAHINVAFNEKQIHQSLQLLIHKNGVQAGNILISYKEHLKIFFIPHKYPSAEMYKSGVACGLLHAERENPNAKVFQTKVREASNVMIAQHHFYEVVLVDHSGRITEGSRSNIFFIQNNRLITPPGNEVLLGITRDKTIALAKKLRIPFSEEHIYSEKLDEYSGAFITGTSPKILPVKNIGKVAFDAAEKSINKLIQAYENLIQEYISSK